VNRSSSTGLSRRGLLGFAGASAVAGLAGGIVVAGGVTADSSRDDPADDSAVPFRGLHQAGIVTPAQDRLHFAAFDVTTTDRRELIEMLRSWTEAAERCCVGREIGPAGAVGVEPMAPPDDTGEALGLPSARLTVTVGFGGSLFTTEKVDRFGLSSRRPAALAALPSFQGDELREGICGGDIGVQACADDPQVAVHAIRNLARIARGVAEIRWSQLGFGRTSSTSTQQPTPRNMMGFKDGTANLTAEDPNLVDRHVWVQPGDGPEWMTGGSYLVTRRIRILIENWDAVSLHEQERVIGRTKGRGAPLSGGDEFDGIDFAAMDDAGALRVPETAHVRLAHPSMNGDARLLRRGYNFVDGVDDLGRLDAGLFFAAYQRDPRKQFVPVQQQLARSDALGEYVRHVGSGVFACPPGVGPGEFWGQRLFR
jgi:deferrochelatase/peroxidase EfeB